MAPAVWVLPLGGVARRAAGAAGGACHEALRGASGEEETQASGQPPGEVASGREGDEREGEVDAQSAAPHAVGILHPENELELLASGAGWGLGFRAARAW